MNDDDKESAADASTSAAEAAAAGKRARVHGILQRIDAILAAHRADCDAAIDLIDSQARARQFPETWESPTDEELVEVKVGDLVKLDFICPRQARVSSERMWVKVTRLKPVGPSGALRFQGVLRNTPSYAKHVDFGTVVDFEGRHVLDWRSA